MKVFLLAAVLGTALAAVSVAGAVKAQTINLLEIQTSFTGMGGLDSTFNTPPKPGQGFALTSDLYRWKGTGRGAHVGTLKAVCTFVSIDLTNYRIEEVCNGGIRLSGGQIAVGGRINQSDTFDVPIVGGTGSYVGAKGYVRVRGIGGDESNNSNDRIVITG